VRIAIKSNLAEQHNREQSAAPQFSGVSQHVAKLLGGGTPVIQGAH
jgi:hypothetical protein